MNYLSFYHCWVKSALTWYIKKLPCKNPKGKNHDTVINNTGLEEKKISKCWDWLHHRIYFMASSKYRELLPLWNVQGVFSKCSQNVGRKSSVQRPEHTHTCATSPPHRHGKSCPTKNSPHKPVPSLRHLLRMWARSHQSRERGLLTSSPLKEGGESPVHILLPGNAL